MVYTELHRDEHAATVVGLIARTIGFSAAHGITIERWRTDNAWVYIKYSDPQASVGVVRVAIPVPGVVARRRERSNRARRWRTMNRRWPWG